MRIEYDLHSGKCNVDNVGEFRLVCLWVLVPQSKEVVQLSHGVDEDRDE